TTVSLIIVTRSGRFVVVRTAGPFRLELLEDPFDAIPSFDGFVVEEAQLRHPFQSQPLTNLTTQEGRCSLERACRFTACLVVADGGVGDACLLEIRRDVDARDRQETDAGIMHVPRQQRRELRTDLIANTRGSGALAHKKGQGRRDKGKGQGKGCDLVPCPFSLAPFYTVAATRSTTKASMMSPILMSL